MRGKVEGRRGDHHINGAEARMFPATRLRPNVNHLKLIGAAGLQPMGLHGVNAKRATLEGRGECCSSWTFREQSVSGAVMGERRIAQLFGLVLGGILAVALMLNAFAS
jgi:hypothetical protein